MLRMKFIMLEAKNNLNNFYNYTKKMGIINQ